MRRSFLKSRAGKSENSLGPRTSYPFGEQPVAQAHRAIPEALPGPARGCDAASARRDARSSRARDEAQALVSELREAFLGPDPRAFMKPLGVRIAGWCDAGVDERAIGEALLAIVRSPALPDPPVQEVLAREKRQSEKFAALLAVSHAVVNTLDLNVILTTIAKKVREVIQTDECTVFLFDEKEQVLYPVVCDAKAWMEEMMAIRLKLGEGITGMVALTGRGEIVDDAETDPRSVSVPGTPPEPAALLCVPLVSQDKVVGVITLSRLGTRTFQQETSSWPRCSPGSAAPRSRTPACTRA